MTVNTVLRSAQVDTLMEAGGERLRGFLRWMQASGVDDFKFLPDSTQAFADVFAESAVREAFQRICREEVPARYGMFHLRLGTLATGGHGFDDTERRPCYHSIDDRVFDSQGAYPCVIQLREGGERVYLRTDTPDEQERKLRRFVASDRRDDAICRRCCFDLYRRLNEAVALSITTAAEAVRPSAPTRT